MAEDGDGGRSGADTPTVFVSYASGDVAVANAIVEALERNGVKCWIAPRNVRPGAFYADAIVQAINTARLLIVLLSANSVGSQHVLREVERAGAKKRPLVAYRLDASPLPAGLEYFLSASQWLDATTSGADSALAELVEAVRHLLTTAAAVESAPRGGMPKLAAVPAPRTPAGAPGRLRLTRPVIALSVVIALGLGYVVVDKLWFSKRTPGDHPVAAVLRTAAPTSEAISDKSIAVLPFVDMSEKKDQEYFADGMAEEVINLLVKIPDLRVPARTSSFYFKGKSTKIPDIARELGVAHILEGSIRRSGNQIRVTAQLVRADNGFHLWSQTYDRELDDIFKVQDEIAGAVVRALKVSLLQGTVSRPVPTSSTEAYTLYLQARAVVLRAGQGDYQTAIGLLRQALALDPRFAAAWAEVADDVIDDFEWNKTRPVEDARAEAHEAAAKAIELDPNLSDGHLARAKILHWMDWNWDAAEAEFRQTLALSPANADALRANANLAQTLGLPDRQLELAQRAVAADPLDSWNYYAVGLAHVLGGRPTSAVDSLRKALELNPTGVALHATLGRALVVAGDPAAGLAEIAREGSDFWRLVFRPYALEALGRKVEADADIATTAREYGANRPGVLGRWYECHHDFDRASIWFERAYRQRDSSLLWIDWCRRSLLSDPRYLALRRKVTLPE